MYNLEKTLGFVRIEVMLMKKKIISLCMAAAVALMPCVPAAAETELPFPDVPADSWAVSYIMQAKENKLLNGYGDGRFGYGDIVTRGEFAGMLANLFGWTAESPALPSFTDVAPSEWFYSYVETALANGAVREGETFRPKDAITREEMAIMLVDALGFYGTYDHLDTSKTPFTDVTSNLGAITMAYDFGIIKGTSATTFAPDKTATREEAATMMVNLFQKLKEKYQFKTGFYAFSSYSQVDMISDLDSVCFGWSKMDVNETGVFVNTSSANQNEWCIPNGFETPLALAKSAETKAMLSVYMDRTQKYNKADGTSALVSDAVLLDATAREAAADAILEQVTLDDRFDGAVVDFEALKGETYKGAFNSFLEVLSAKLKVEGKLLYVAVPPVLPNGQEYYDGYDYAKIGALADKVILMAYDYEATSLTEGEMQSGYTFTPLTPFEDVYYAIKAIFDPATGVSDHSKVVLGLNFDSAQWMKQDGKVINSTPLRPTYSRIAERLQMNGAAVSYHERYRNPMLTFYDETDQTNNIVWYEDERSIGDKLLMAKLLGVKGLSVWRLGNIPDASNAAGSTNNFNLNVWDLIQNR